MMKKYFTHSLGCLLFACISSASNGQFITNSGVSVHNSAFVTTNGEWINDAGTIIRNDGVIKTNAMFINNGTLDVASTGGFALQFGEDITFRPGGSRMGFLTKEGPGLALVDGTVSVRDSLLIRNGIIRLVNATDTIGVGPGGLVVAGATTYVEGIVARAGTGDLLFPMGRDGLFLPVKIYKAQAQKITATVLPAPGGMSAGPGVDALIDFPYVWKVSEKFNADTAAYIEVDYPNTLPTVANPVIAREVPGSQYASMGARLISNAAGRAVVKSYSRGLKGVFTVAQGFPTDLATDSLALVALYNGTGGPSWTTKTNWLTGTVDTWFGVTVNGQSITALNLPSNKLTGSVPDPLVDIQALQTVNLSGNSITAIPDFTLNTEITTLNVSNNRLTFASLEPNAAVPGLNYLVQADIGDVRDELVPVGTPVEFHAGAGGGSSQYQWRRNGTLVPSSNTPVYAIANIGRENMGEYTAAITNPQLPGLTLHTVPQRVRAYASLGGKLMATATQPATRGSMTLFRVTPSAYDTIAVAGVQPDGNYAFDQIVLDDYQLLGFADTLVHNQALPTYYQNTILWEEADTLFLAGNTPNLTIVSQREPGASSGKGRISGFLEEEIEEARTKKPKRVSSAGVSARRVENTGRGKEEILTLVAYVFTNENGEFVLPDLPTGTYRLNIQYPGYPMDDNSFVTIPIGTALESQVSVEAHVIDGKINVRKLIITGLPQESETYTLDVYPNPAVDFIRLDFGTESKGRAVSLTDMTGKTMFTLAAEDKEAIVNVQTLNNGIYLLRISEGGVTVKTLKLSIE